jgi:hypothetical protein
MFINNSKLFMKLGSYALSKAPIVSQVASLINNNEDIFKKAIESKETAYKSLGFMNHNYKSFSYAAGSALAVNIAESCAKIAIKQAIYLIKNITPLTVKQGINYISKNNTDLSYIYKTPISKLTGNEIINFIGKSATSKFTDKTEEIVKNYTPTSKIIKKGLSYIDSNKSQIKNFLSEAYHSAEQSIAKDSINEAFTTFDKSLNAGIQAVIDSAEEKFIFDTEPLEAYEAINVGSLDQIEDYN